MNSGFSVTTSCVSETLYPIHEVQINMLVEIYLIVSTSKHDLITSKILLVYWYITNANTLHKVFQLI